NEGALVPPDALHPASRGFRPATRVGVGRHRPRPVRRPLRPHALQRVYGRARTRRRARLRRHLRERAPPERVRADAVAEPDRREPRASHERRRDRGAGQLTRALQPARARRGRDGDARLHLGRAAGGRISGRHADGHHAYGQNPSQLRERYFEAHDLILRAWQADAPFTWNGRYNQLRYVNVWPRPGQKPHPPVWIPGGGSIETWHWCAESDYVYSYLSYFGYKQGRATMKGYWQELARLGVEPNPYRGGFLQFVGVADSRQAAVELYREPAEYFYGRCLHVDPRFATAPGYMSEASLRARVQSQVARAAAQSREGAARGGPRIEEIVEQGFVIIGSPDEVADQLRE